MSEQVIGKEPAEVNSKVEAEANPTGEVKVESPEQSRRMEVEAKVTSDNSNQLPEPEAKVEETQEKKVESEETSPVKAVKDRIQKRIDKEVAKRKTAEEELAEVRAENEKLKAQIKPETTSESDANREPTDAEIRTALIKAKKDGDTEFEVQILEYMAERKAKKERAEAEKAMSDANSNRTKAQEQFQKDWTILLGDYRSENSDLDLSNPKGLLYRISKELYEDKELSKTVYSDPNKSHAMRRAVSDAYREIMENNLLQRNEAVSEEAPPSKSVERKRSRLADPSSQVAEEVTQKVKELSDTEKVLNEVKARRKFQEERNRQ